MKKSKASVWLARCLWLPLIAAATALDQWTKLQASLNWRETPRVLIPGVLELTYTENTGAAWSMLSGRQTLLIVITAVMLGAVLAALIFGKWRHPVLQIGEALLTAGGIGNLIDRVGNRFVVDYLYVRAIDFPVFNIADCYVTVGAALLMVYVIFLEKGDLRGDEASAANRDSGGTAGQNGSADPLGDAGNGTKVD